MTELRDVACEKDVLSFGVAQDRTTTVHYEFQSPQVLIFL